MSDKEKEEVHRKFDVFLDGGPDDDGNPPKETPSVENRTAVLWRTYLWSKLQWIAIFLVSGGGFAGIWKGWDELSMFNTANAQQKVEIAATRKELDAHLLKDAQEKAEARKDMKALYDAVTKRKKSKRLEAIDAGEEDE